MKTKNTKTFDWDKNKYVLYILFSLVKHHILTKKYTHIPCNVKDPHTKELTLLINQVTGYNFTTNQIGGQLRWLHSDKNNFDYPRMRNIKIALEVELINERDFIKIVNNLIEMGK